MSPKRIQRKRVKGWRMPEGTVYVGRPTMWGNPFSDDDLSTAQVIVESPQEAVTMYREHLAFRRGLDPSRWDISELRGRDLACWCALDVPCHADVLLEIANA